MRRKHFVLIAGGIALLAAGYVASTYHARVLFDEASAFGRVRVVEHSSGTRQLRTGERGVLQTSLSPDRPRELESAYTRVAMIGLAVAPPAPRILFIGLGGGAMPTYVRLVAPDARIDVVEIDPVIVDVAQRYFGFRPDTRMNVFTADGRAFLERAPPGSYDLIVLDAFSADEVPYALTTHEFLTTVRSRLAAGGVAVSNLWSSAPAYPSMLATWTAVFDDIQLIRVPRRRQRILLAGSPKQGADGLATAARALANLTDLGFDLEALVRHGYEGRPSVRAAVLRDAARQPD
jgi:spermidine synthase